MGASSRRQRGLKRRRTPEKSAEQRVVERISPEVGGDSHMGEEEDVSDNMVVHKEHSVYDNLLMRLRSDNKVLSDAYKRRLRREEDESDTEEKEDDPNSFDNTNHDDLNKEIEDESAGEEVGTPEEINRIDNDSAESEETDAEDGCESPDTEEEYQMGASSSEFFFPLLQSLNLFCELEFSHPRDKKPDNIFLARKEGVLPRDRELARGFPGDDMLSAFFSIRSLKGKFLSPRLAIGSIIGACWMRLWAGDSPLSQFSFHRQYF